MEQAAKTKLKGLEHKLKESEANAKSLEESLEEKANAANTKAEQLQGNVTAAEGNAKGMEKKLEAANTTAKDLQSKVTAAEQKARELEDQVNAANARADALQEQVKTAEDKAKDLAKEVSEGNKRAKDLEGKLNNANAKVKKLDGVVETANTKAKALEQAVETANTEANELKGKVTSAKKSLNKANKSDQNSQSIIEALRRYAQSQLNLFGISDEAIQEKTLVDWNNLNAAYPTIRADAMDTVEHYQLMFVVPPMDLVVIDTGDLAVAQIWFLVPIRLDAFLIVRHYARKPGLSPKQIHILQDILSKAIGAIVNAQAQDVFAVVLVAIHALLWLNTRVKQLSDHEERTEALQSMWEALAVWLQEQSLIPDSRIVGVLRNGLRREGPPDANGSLDCSNSAIEQDQWLLPDPGWGQFAWLVGDTLKVFGRKDVRCVENNISTGGMVLHFKGVMGSVCLCRRMDQTAHVLHWVYRFLDDDCIEDID